MLCMMKDIITRLKESYELTVCGQFPEVIRGMKKLPRDQNIALDCETLYACTANDLEDYGDVLENIPLLCAIGRDYVPEVSLLGRKSVILVKGVYLPDLLMTVADIMFDLGMKQSPLSEARRDLLLCQEPEDMMKLAYKYVKLPMFFTTVTLKILCHSGSIEVDLIKELYSRGGCFNADLRKASSRPAAVMEALGDSHQEYYPQRLDDRWSVFCFPQYQKKSLSGFLLVFSREDQLTQEQEDICGLLKNVLALELPRLESNSKANVETPESFLEGLINARLAREEDISRSLEQMQWKQARVMHVIVPSMNGLLPAKDLKQSRRALEEASGGWRAFDLDSGIVMLYEGDNPLYSGARDENIRNMEEFLRDNGLCAGVSRPFGSFAVLRSAFYQASKAMTNGARLMPGESLHFYEDMAVYHMMEFAGNYIDLSSLLATGFDKLITLDRQEGKELIRTLEVYTDCCGSIGKCAEKLFVHVNTVKYRIKQISEVLECDLKDGQAFFRAAMSVRILRYIEQCRNLQHPYSELQGRGIK